MSTNRIRDFFDKSADTSIDVCCCTECKKLCEERFKNQRDNFRYVTEAHKEQIADYERENKFLWGIIACEIIGLGIYVLMLAVL